ncbi:carbamoyl-phosphate synthase L chain, ATP binding domain-containing protein [Blastocladiella britannica]|nr:carbamoyl-phosphate synthase L chain, ATP binding domain-containing protein [Blastocladiella britannica]
MIAADPAPKPIRRVLVANRGEIASRVFRSCKLLGLSTAAVFSDADAQMPYVRDADVSLRIGPPAAAESYLNIPALIAAAHALGADAVHPGYGFLSENVDFAQAVLDAGLAWIGPRPRSITAIGDKRRAKELLQAKAPHIPLVPGYHGADQSEARLVREAAAVGFPLLLKAAAGGGGKGMRVVNNASELKINLASACGEALRSFGSSEMVLERYFDTIKHVEVQILGDLHGTIVSLGTRECSLQRRHQKVIEEAPAPAHLLSGNGPDALTMEQCAIKIGQVVEYCGVGTVEFLVDTTTGRFYFLEVNTRLQVEHPVTEQVTGLDLVALQLHVVMGAALKDLIPAAFPTLCFPTLRTHSIELRINAEDPKRDFAPATGQILAWRPPATSASVRIESSVSAGSTVSVWYDAMIAKLIVTAPTRAECIRLAIRALRDHVCLGVATNRPLLLALLGNLEFGAHSHTTGTVAQVLALPLPVAAATRTHQEGLAAIASTVWVAAKLARDRRAWGHVPAGWRNVPHAAATPVATWLVNGTYWHVSHVSSDPAEVQPVRRWAMTLQSTTEPAPARDTGSVPTPEGLAVELIHLESNGTAVAGSVHDEVLSMTLSVSGRATTLSVAVSDRAIKGMLPRAGVDGVALHFQGYDFDEPVILEKQSKIRLALGQGAAEESDARAIMPCRILQIAVQQGQTVAKGDLLLVVESMKMETRLVAKAAGTVEVRVKEGQLVEAGTLMAHVNPGKE